MNKITTINSNKPAPTAKNLTGYLRADRFVQDHGPAILSATRLPTIYGWERLAGRERRAAQRDALEVYGKYLARIPSVPEMIDARDTLAAVLKAPFDAKLTLFSVMLMLDAFPSGRPANPERYFELMLIDLEDAGFPPAVIVAGCQHLRRTSKFLPSISEMLEACRTRLDQYRTYLRATEKAIETREDAERYITRTRTALEAEAPSVGDGLRNLRQEH